MFLCRPQLFEAVNSHQHCLLTQTPSRNAISHEFSFHTMEDESALPCTKNARLSCGVSPCTIEACPSGLCGTCIHVYPSKLHLLALTQARSPSPPPPPPSLSLSLRQTHPPPPPLLLPFTLSVCLCFCLSLSLLAAEKKTPKTKTTTTTTTKKKQPHNQTNAIRVELKGFAVTKRSY